MAAAARSAAPTRVNYLERVIADGAEDRSFPRWLKGAFYAQLQRRALQVA